MRRFLGFLRKEFLHIFRDKRTLIVLFGIPVSQLLIFGFVIVNEIKSIDILVVDRSNDEISRAVISKLDGNPLFNVISDPALTDYDTVFRKGTIHEIIVFENNFAEKLVRDGTVSIQILADGSEPNTAHLIVNYTEAVLQDFLLDFRQTMYNSTLQPSIRTRMLFNEELRSPHVFVPGTMALILMLISAMMTSISITREKEMGSMEILLASPMKPYQIVAGKVLPYLILSVFNAVVIIFLGFCVFRVPLEGSIVLLLGESILFIAMALALGILISTISPNQQFAMMISMFALMMPTMLLSGFVFPIDSMPKILQWFSVIMPPRWFIVIIKRIMLKGTDFSFVWRETVIIFGMFVLFMGLSIKKFKIRLE